jgi:guanylate kinase
LNNSKKFTGIERRGMMIVLSSPSGAGKTTLSRRLLARDDDITMSVSVTTRAPRSGEIDGEDYIFVSSEEFAAMRDHGELLEWAQVFGNFYGTPRAPVEAILSQGRDVLFDIDWQGTQQLMEEMSKDVVRIFILPPSAEALGQRLKTRAQDSAEVVAARMEKASAEISHWAEYDYVLINDELETCDKALASIVHAERLTGLRRSGLTAFVRNLRDNL